MRCADWKTDAICRHDCGHGGDLGSRTLSVSQVVLPDLLSNRNYNALPANHRPKTQCKRDGNLYPVGNELGSDVDVLLVMAENSFFVRTEFRLVRLLYDPQGFANNVHIIAEVAHPLRRNVSERFEFLYFVTDLVNVLPQSKHCIVFKISGPDVVGQVVARVSDYLRAVEMIADHVRGLSRHCKEVGCLCGCYGVVLSVVGRYCTHQNEHD